MAKIAGISVPEEAVSVLIWLAKLPKEDQSAILAAATSFDAKAPSRNRIKRHFQKSLEGMDASRASELTSMLLSLVGLHQIQDFDLGAIAETVAYHPSLSLEDNERENLTPLLTSLLTATPIYISAKALDIAEDNQFLFEWARILSDIRPIFAEKEGAEQQRFAAIVYTLKIGYADIEGRKEIYLALEEKDLDLLEKIISSARRDSASLKKFLRAAGATEVRPNFS